MQPNSERIEIMDAALRGSFTFLSRKEAKGNSNMENRQEKIKGDKISFATIVM